MKCTKITTELSKQRYWQTELLDSPANMDYLHAICVYPELTGQVFEGFGGAFTEAAGVSWQKLSPSGQAELVNAYFGAEGLGYVLGRTHMGSCDFALGNYTAAVQDSVQRDFSRDDANLIPLIQAAQKQAGTPLGLLLSPWSPPAWMKSNGEMNHGGQLLPECAARYAGLIADYVSHYRAAGLDVRMVSVQNEPEAVQTWDSCIFTAEEEGRFAADILRPALDSAGLSEVQILIWDHNKESLLRRANGTFSVPGAAQAVSGVAFHWYTGDHFEAVELARRRYPEKKFYFTEGCVEYSRFDGASDLKKAEMYAHDILGNLNAGIAGSIDWNLLLDSKGGPNHVGNFCEAPIMLNARGGLEYKGSYYYIGQFSRYIRPGALRLETSRYCAELEVTAFRNPDGSTAVVLLNRTDTELPACLSLNGETPLAQLSVPTHSLTTVLIS